MPEAVIVATGRTPIGRAFKGTLVDMRPDDLTVAARHPAPDPAEPAASPRADPFSGARRHAGTRLRRHHPYPGELHR